MLIENYICSQTGISLIELQHIILIHGVFICEALGLLVGRNVKDKRSASTLTLTPLVHWGGNASKSVAMYT